MATVLIVDDDHHIVYLLKMVLEGHGFNIVGTAANGQIAVEKYKTLPEKPDIIIMDYRMPIKDGIEALNDILKIDGCSRIIMATADVEVKREALKAGALKVINKPFKFEELFDSINELLR